MREGGNDALSRLLQTSHSSSKDSLDLRVVERGDRKVYLPRGDAWVRHSKEWSFTSSNWKSNPLRSHGVWFRVHLWAWGTAAGLNMNLKADVFSIWDPPTTSQVWNLSCTRKVTGQTLLRGSKEKWETFPAGFLFIVLDQEIPNPRKFSGKLWRLFQNLSS